MNSLVTNKNQEIKKLSLVSSNLAQSPYSLEIGALDKPLLSLVFLKQYYSSSKLIHNRNLRNYYLNDNILDANYTRNRYKYQQHVACQSFNKLSVEISQSAGQYRNETAFYQQGSDEQQIAAKIINSRFDVIKIQLKIDMKQTEAFV